MKEHFKRIAKISFLACLIFIGTLILASQEVKGYKVEYYSNVDKIEVNKVLEFYNLSNYGIKKMVFKHTPKTTFRGLYTLGDVIIINTAYLDYNTTLRHELGHAVCWKRYKYLGHNETFRKCVEEVK